jgi:acyl-[acyl carrier protein]--UDP-N-acetylglucosamine O-acyltransferase
MSNFAVDYGADNGEIVSTINYLLSNLGNAPNGLIINRQTGQIINTGTNTTTAYLYRYINIGWANNVQGLYFSSASNNQTYYGISNADDPAYPTDNRFAFLWSAIGSAGAIGPANGIKLWYSVGGGRTITFAFAATAPDSTYSLFADGVAIDLDAVTAVGNAAVIGNNTVIGSNVTIGNYLTIGDYWKAGQYGTIANNVSISGNASIGANLNVTGLITSSVLNASTVGTTQIVNLSVTNGKLANSSVTSAKIADYTIQATDIGNNVITTDQVATYTLVGDNLANLTITGQQVADYTLVGTKLANLTVDTQQIAASAVTGNKLANSSVTSAKIANYTIVATDIANLTITGDQVADYSLPATKLANGSITGSQIQDYSITGLELANATVTSNKLSVSTLSSITPNAGNITSGQITGGSAGGATTITGYTAGISAGFGNTSTPNFTDTALTTFTVLNATTRVFISVTGSVNHWDTQANLTYYNAFRGNTVVDVLYSNATVRNSFTNFTTASAVYQRVSGTQFNYRLFVPFALDTSLLLPPDTYTIQIRPQLLFVDNTQGNLVVTAGTSPSTSAQTFQGRAATFQANIT